MKQYFEGQLTASNFAQFESTKQKKKFHVFIEKGNGVKYFVCDTGEAKNQTAKLLATYGEDIVTPKPILSETPKTTKDE